MVDRVELFSRGGEMAELIRATDWSTTPLGPKDCWPKSLETMLGVVLGSRFPMLLWWGPDLLHLYNDAYRPILRDKHPASLGAPAATIWAEVWDVAGPMANGVLAGGPATWTEDLQLFIHNGAMAEETYFTFSYSPVPGDDGRVGGVLNTVQETTEKVQGERQIRMLHELALGAASAKSEAEAYRLVSDVLSGNELDLPFALIYEVDADASAARLVGRTGSAAEAMSVERVALDDVDDARTWPLASVVASAHDLVVEDLSARFGPLPEGTWGSSPERAVILPLMRPGQSIPHAILVAGVSPHRVLDDRYRRFFRATADQTLAALTMAAGYEAETKRAEALAEIDRAKTTFFGNVSHEFRTPLTLILGPIEDALASTDRSISGDALQMVHRNTMRLMRLVNSVLDFSRVESGRADAEFVPTDLATMTANLASAFRSAVERNRVELIVECETLPEDVYVDPEQWEKIVLNLLSNALKFTFEGSIRVSLRARDSSVELIVADTGTGIPEAELPRIFDRFHQVRGGRSRTHEGSGIGLALVRDLVRLHGGNVVATSRVGEGTTFVVTIPKGFAHLPSTQIGTSRSARASNAAAAFVEESIRWADGADLEPPSLEAKGTAGTPAAPRSGLILVVDDNADLRDYIVELLADTYEVDIAANGVTALEKARQRKPDLVLSDVMMPELDGFGLLRAIREDPFLRGVSVILLSARAGEDATVDGLAAGADDYLVKPFASRELLARVRTHIALARQREELRRLNELLAKSNEELARSTQAKSDFLAMMSHELRTPLNAIIGFSEILIDRKFGELNDRQARYLRNVLDGGRHLLTLINELLDLSKVEAGRLELVTSSCAALSLVTDAVATLRPLAETKGVALLIERDASVLPPLYVDSLRAKQVVYNLLSNAIKFTPSGGRVTIGFERSSPTMLRIGVRDTGPGIAPEEIGRLFRPFSQLESGRASGVGTGLGLALTKQLVELMGGTVGVESKQSVGSYFFVDLPIDLSFVSKTESSEVPAGDPPLALVVDDDETARELLDLTLRAEGYRVMVTSSGEEALVCARRYRPALITLDVFLPGIDGWEVLRAIRGDPTTADIPVVMVTISGERRTAFGLGAVEHLVKPVDRALLLGALAKRNFTAKLKEGPVHVLVVDDDGAHRSLMRAALEPSGFVVTAVGTGREAISVARTGRVDLVLLDLVLPDISGIEVVQAIRDDARVRDIPILLVTASEIDEASRNRLNGDVASVLAKATLDVSALKGEIERVVRRPS